MRWIDLPRRAARVVVRRPARRHAAVAFLVSLAAPALAFVLAMAGFAFLLWNVDACQAAAGRTSESYAACYRAALTLARAEAAILVPAFLVLTAVSLVAFAAVPALLLAAHDARERNALARDRVARLEEAFARGALTDEAYARSRALLIHWRDGSASGLDARDEARLLAWALALGTLPLLAALALGGYLLSFHWSELGGAILPGAHVALPLLGLGALAWAALAYRRARAEARESLPRSERELEETWESVLEEARAASLGSLRRA